MIKITSDKRVLIQTPRTSFVLALRERGPALLYYGNHLEEEVILKVCQPIDLFDKHASVDIYDFTPTIFSVQGDAGEVQPMFRFINEKGIYVNRFSLKDAVILNGFKGQDNFPKSRLKSETLKLTYVDELRDLIINQYISTFVDSDVLAFSNEVINNSKKTITIKKAMSLQIDLFGKDNVLTTLDGSWSRERFIHNNIVNNGTFMVGSNNGYSSNTHNPFVILNHDKAYYGVNLIYSGSHAQIVDVSALENFKGFILKSELAKGLILEKTRFLSGINETNFAYSLKPNKTFTTPEAIITYANNVDDITTVMHSFIRNHIVRNKWSNILPPVLLNSWEGIYFDFNHDKIIAMVEKAKENGIGLFVLDDGWFGKRDADNISLGDWVDYKEKTGGIDKLVQEIKSIGLKFGLWFEPEMLNMNSDVFRKHPDYAMIIPGLKPIERRNQLMLDFTRRDVRDSVFKQITKIIDLIKPYYIKLDSNRTMIDVYSSFLNNQEEFQYKYMQGLYDFWGKLIKRYPHILFEGCSAGGNRFDLGTLYYFPQIWASDNTDTLMRTFIQEGTLLAYPQSTIGSHVAECPNATTGLDTPLESRFNIASLGAFGYELNMLKVKEVERKVMKEQIKFYTKYGKLLRNGIYHKLSSVYNSDVYAHLIVNESKTEAIITIGVFLRNTNWENIKVNYLNDDDTYLIKTRVQSNLEKVLSFKMTGRELKEKGIDIQNIIKEEKNELNDTLASRIYLVKKI
ncbi:MAG: alpha-galactosidase [Bacillales bacterium]|jgi:alpha-galactosidase|nr:alpha-galactosidase [Bacillales bacterium]